MAEKRGVTKKIKADVVSMNSTLQSLDKYIKKLHDDLNQMMGYATGSGIVGPAWNGRKAKIFYQKAVKNLKNNIIDYEYVANLVSTLGAQYEIAAKADAK